MSGLRILIIYVLTLVFIPGAQAQERPIGYWRSHFPYNSAVNLATDGNTFFVPGDVGFYTWDRKADELTAYSKAEGMADVGLVNAAYDMTTGYTVLAYKNSNIDLFKDGSFFNLPDLKLKTVSSTKKINHIFTEEGLAYVSTDIGIVVINLAKKEVKETYTFMKNGQVIPVSALIASGGYLYTITSKGLYKASKTGTNLQSFAAWTQLDTTRKLVALNTWNNNVYTATLDSAFVLNGSSFNFMYHAPDSSIAFIEPGVDGLWMGHYYEDDFNGKLIKLDNNYAKADSFFVDGKPTKIIEESDNGVWLADAFRGLRKRDKGAGTPGSPRIPPGPNDFGVFDLYAYNKELLVAHGGYNQFYVYAGNRHGFSRFNNETWSGYQIYSFAPFGDSVYDITDIIKAPDGNIYAASNQSGLIMIRADGSTEIYKQNSIIDSAELTGAASKYRVTGLATDKNGNIWMTVMGGYNSLVVKTKDGNWYEYSVRNGGSFGGYSGDNVIVDGNSLKWFAAPGAGLVVYDDNETPENPNDDRYKQLLTGKGAGNLPDNAVNCIVEDKTGALWVGTGNGIGIINCPVQVLDNECEAEQRVVQYDEFPGHLFQNEIVKTIAVDGANRKWIGTNNGVWLISADGDYIISRFNADNSPLPSDIINKITIDPVTGDVYIGTETGVVSYRGTATDGGEQNKDVLVFPNPVPSAFKGTIAIKGLVENADVRITDISGQLVYRTKALGGQAVWSGMDYTGRRPQSGVYLVFATNKDGSQTHVAKMVFMQ
jgi:ligand-binding sensor domain-containing protein